MSIEENNQNIVNAIGLVKGYPKGTSIDIKNVDKEILSIKIASGNAQPSDVLSGKTFSNDSGEQTGTMQVYNGSNAVYPSQAGTTLATNGNYMTSNISVRGDANFKAENIKAGVKIWNVTGTAPSGVEIKSITKTIDPKLGRTTAILNNSSSNYRIVSYSFIYPASGRTRYNIDLYNGNSKVCSYNNEIYGYQEKTTINRPVFSSDNSIKALREIIEQRNLNKSQSIVSLAQSNVKVNKIDFWTDLGTSGTGTFTIDYYEI